MSSKSPPNLAADDSPPSHDSLTATAPNAPAEGEEPYSIFSRSEKWIIVSLTALAGLFSPLTSNVYLPALPTISREFNKSVELINLTVTVYIVMQGVAPMIWGPLADRYGRRPCYAGCLLLLSASNVGLALVPTSAYWLLMLLRCLQATGSASTIAIGAGVIGDISTREERGGLFGFFTLGPMVGPVIGPVIGGGIADSLGWRAIFWFLTIASALCAVTMILLVPETLRSIVGNGSVRASSIYRPLLPFIPKIKPSKRRDKEAPRKHLQNPFRLFTNVDILILLAVTAIVNSVMYGIITTISTTFEVAYPFLTETTIGLCFLAYGVGMMIGSVVHGKVLDREYQKFKRKLGISLEDSANLSRAEVLRGNIAIEKARLRLLPVMMALFAGSVGGYGWALQRNTSIAVPLVLQAIHGYIAMAAMNSASTLMIDLFPDQSSSVTACNNLVRCTLAAVIVSVMQPLINRIGLGWTYTILCFLALFTIPLIFLVILVGPRYRLARQNKVNGLDETEMQGTLRVNEGAEATKQEEP